MFKKLYSALMSFYHLYQAKSNPVDYARSLGVSIGADARLISIKPGEGTFGSEPYLISIGDHVTITGDVQFVTHDGGVWVFREKYKDIDVFAPIKIGDNVFIGYGSIIMPGVEIGSNVVVGAGSIVTKSIPSDSVAVGVPAKVIQSLDDYLETSLSKADFIRNIPVEEKKTILISKFGLYEKN